MPMQLTRLVIDAVDPGRLAEFWAWLLGWDVTGPAVVRPPAADGCDFDLAFVAAAGLKDRAQNNRIHLDLAAYSPEDQAARIERAIGLGAQPWDIGQGDVPWEVMIDPEGNEFCVLEPRPGYTSGGALAAIVVDSLDPAAIAAFWSAAIGWPAAARQEAIVGLRAPSGRGPWLEFLRTAEPKKRANRLRLEITGSAELTDPEGNEFLVRQTA